jgi:hypothetical protein
VDENHGNEAVCDPCPCPCRGPCRLGDNSRPLCDTHLDLVGRGLYPWLYPFLYGYLSSGALPASLGAVTCSRRLLFFAWDCHRAPLHMDALSLMECQSYVEL